MAILPAGETDIRGVRSGRWETSETSATVVALVAIVIFCLLASWHVWLPGLYYDELIQIVPAFAFVRGPLLSAVGGQPASQVDLFGRTLALMTMDYIGAVKQIAFLPVAAVAGITPESIRFFTIGVSAVSLLATFAFARRLFDPTVAAVAIALLATDPSAIFFSRVDYGPTVFMFLLKAVALWQLARWWQTRSLVSLGVGSLALGLGLYDKANFIWIVGAIVGAVIVVAPRGLLARITPKAALVAALGIIVGAWPLIWFNLTWPPRTVAALLGPSLHEPAAGGLLAQLGQRLSVLLLLLDGRQVTQWLGDGAPTLPIMPALLAISVAAIVVQCLIPSRRRTVGPAAFVLLCGGLILLAAALTRGGFAMHHLILIYPFPHLVVAAVIGQAAARLRAIPRRGAMLAARLVIGIAVVVPVAANLLVYRTTIQQLEQIGGRGYWSDAVYRLSDFLLAADPDRPVVVLDWGIHFNLVALSQGRLLSLEVWPGLNDAAGSPAPLQQLLQGPGNRFVLHVPSASAFPLPRERFFAIVDQSGMQPTLRRRIAARDGTPVFEVYTVGPRAGAARPVDSPPMIQQIHPSRTTAGQRFQAQPNGQAAIAVAGEHITPRTAIVFGSTPLLSTYVSPNLVTAYVPDALFAQPGRYEIRLRGENGESDPVEFLVNP